MKKDHIEYQDANGIHHIWLEYYDPCATLETIVPIGDEYFHIFSYNDNDWFEILLDWLWNNRERRFFTEEEIQEEDEDYLNDHINDGTVFYKEYWPLMSRLTVRPIPTYNNILTIGEILEQIQDSIPIDNLILYYKIENLLNLPVTLFDERIDLGYPDSSISKERLLKLAIYSYFGVRCIG